ncbi:MAG TPA: dephospho-CoA kinase [Alphaproteobacteria bacterium]|jgi:dephospho-CoA kinase
MVVLGLTGSIGMGKSEAGRTLRRMGVPVFSADEEVRRLTGPRGAALPAIARAFPGTVTEGRLDRQAVAKLVFDVRKDPERLQLRKLEGILHPRVQAAERRFLQAMRAARRSLVALDIPLLFETDARHRVDAVAVVSAPAAIQTARVLRRRGMDAAKLAAVRANQMPDVEKRRLADYVIRTGASRRDSLAALKRLVADLRSRKPAAAPSRRTLRKRIPDA